jgi:DNA-binding protein HU-beta
MFNMAKLNKKALVKLVQEIVDLGTKSDGTEVRSTNKAANAYTEAVFNAIATALSEGNNVAVAGHGVYEVRDRSARKGRNPQTGAEIQIPATKTAALRVTGLKEAVKA